MHHTQGAGAVAMLIKNDPAILAFSPTWGVATKSREEIFLNLAGSSKNDL